MRRLTDPVLTLHRYLLLKGLSEEIEKGNY